MFGRKKKIKRNPYYNFDGEKFYDEYEENFLLDFNEEQKDILKYGISLGYPVNAVAYPYVSAECMEAGMTYMSKFKSLMDERGIKTTDIWKTVMVFDNPDICKAVLWCKMRRIDIFKEFDDVRQLKEEDIQHIVNAASYRINICPKIKKGIPYDEIEKSITFKVAISNVIGNISDFIYFFFNPESEIKAMMKRYKKAAAKQRREEKKRRRKEEKTRDRNRG